MLEILSKGFKSARASLSGKTTLDESNIKDALREVRLSLLEADVEFNVVKRFLSAVETKAIGELVVTHSQPEYAKKNMEVGEAMHLLYRGRCKELYLQMDRNGDGSLSPAEPSSAAPLIKSAVHAVRCSASSNRPLCDLSSQNSPTAPCFFPASVPAVMVTLSFAPHILRIFASDSTFT